MWYAYLILAITLGACLGVINLAFSMVGSAILSIVGNFVFVRVDDNRLHIGNALFLTFCLAVPGVFVQMVELAVVGDKAKTPAGVQLATISMITFALLLTVNFIRVSGLLRRMSPKAADKLDNFIDWILADY